MSLLLLATTWSSTPAGPSGVGTGSSGRKGRMLTFGDLRSETLAWLDESNAAVDSATYVNVENALRQAHTLRLTEDIWPFMLWPRAETINITASQQLYPLHQAFLRGASFRDTTHGSWLTETPSRAFVDGDVDEFTDQDTGRFILWSRQSVATQPTAASVMTIVSTSASDTTSDKAILIYGDTTFGLQEETIIPNGTTPVSGTVSFTQIISVTKSAEWVGTLTLSAGSTTLLNLFSDEFGRSYPTIQLLYTPTGAATVRYRFYRVPRELINSNDLTDIPPPFERILVYDALMLLAAYDNRLGEGRGNLWSSMRDDLDTQLRQTVMGGQTVNAEPKFIRSLSHHDMVG